MVCLRVPASGGDTLAVLSCYYIKVRCLFKFTALAVAAQCSLRAASVWKAQLSRMGPPLCSRKESQRQSGRSGSLLTFWHRALVGGMVGKRLDCLSSPSASFPSGPEGSHGGSALGSSPSKPFSPRPPVIQVHHQPHSPSPTRTSATSELREP